MAAARWAVALVCLLCVVVAAEKQLPQEVTMSQLHLQAYKAHQRAEIVFGQGPQVYNMGVDDGQFYIDHADKNLFSINQHGQVDVHTSVFDVNRLAASDLSIGGRPQFKMVSLEMFEDTPNPHSMGWSCGDLLKCQGVNILHDKAQDPTKASCAKQYIQLPHHTKVRLTGTAHFVDDWQDETAYIKVDDHIMWTKSHNQRNMKGAVDVCGSKAFPEGQFSVPFDFTFPHTADSLAVAYGSTLPTGAQAFFGLSSLSVYLLNDLQNGSPNGPVPAKAGGAPTASGASASGSTASASASTSASASK